MSASQSPSEFLAELCKDGRTPGDRELALAQAVSHCGIAEQLERIGDYLERIASDG